MTKDENGPKEIPEGTYDVGEGYYEPIKSIIYTYKGEILRTPSEQEVENIIKKCRYNPRKTLVISGDEDKIIKHVISESSNQLQQQSQLKQNPDLDKKPHLDQKE